MRVLHRTGECVGALFIIAAVIAVGYGAAMHLAGQAIVIASAG
jgi:hypothetical protein